MRHAVKELEDVFAITRDSQLTRDEDRNAIYGSADAFQDIDPDDPESVRAGLRRIYSLAEQIQSIGHGDNIRRGVETAAKKLGMRVGPMNDQPREPKGTPAGGQFAAKESISSATDTVGPLETSYRRRARRVLNELEDVFKTLTQPEAAAIDRALQNVNPDDKDSITLGLKRVFRLAGDAERREVKNAAQKLGIRLAIGFNVDRRPA